MTTAQEQIAKILAGASRDIQEAVAPVAQSFDHSDQPAIVSQNVTPVAGGTAPTTHGSAKVADEDEEVEEAAGDPSDKALKKEVKDYKKAKGDFDKANPDRPDHNGDAVKEEKSDEDDDDKDDDKSEKDDDDKKDKKTFPFDKKDVDEHIAALFNGENLSEDFKKKAATILEAALNAKSNSIRDAIVADYESEVKKGLAENYKELGNKVNAYLDYVVEEYMTENKLEIQNGLRTEIIESFIGGLRNLFVEHAIEVPETSVKVLDEMSVKITTLEKSLNDTINENVELKKVAREARRKEIVSESIKGLADTDASKFNTLVEAVSYDNEKDFQDKLKTLRESYFTTKPTPEKKVVPVVSDSIEEPGATNEITEEVAPGMDVYAASANRLFKK